MSEITNTAVSTVVIGETLEQKVARLEAELAAKSRPKNPTYQRLSNDGVGVQVSEAKPATEKRKASKGGAISVFGFRDMPILNLYQTEFLKLYPYFPQILAWMQQPHVKAELDKATALHAVSKKK